jgi:hypothetical protein
MVMVTHDQNLKSFAHRVGEAVLRLDPARVVCDARRAAVHMLDGKIHRIEIIP